MKNNKILYKGMTIIDGTGREPIENGALLVEGEKIISVGKSDILNPEKDYQTVDLSGYYLLPGIINCHTHITYNYGKDRQDMNIDNMSYTLATINGLQSLEELLSCGVTFIRDLGAPGHVDIEIKKARNLDIIKGAELLVSGLPICMTGGHGWRDSLEVDGRDEAIKAARAQLKAGADVLKVMASGGHSEPGIHPKQQQLTVEEIQAVCDVAHYADKKVAAHASGAVTINSILDAGIDSVEHGHLFVDDDKQLVEKVVIKMLNNKTYYVPTLLTWFNKNYIPRYGVKGQINEEGLYELEELKTKEGRSYNGPGPYTCLKEIIDSFNMLYKANVKIAMGTDSISHRFDHKYYPFELKLMILGGMSPNEAIMASTKNSAELLGIDDYYGTIESGKCADFIILNDDPLKDIDNLYKIKSVYKKGKLFK